MGINRRGRPPLDLDGRRFARLLVLARKGSGWLCGCSCGQMITVTAKTLTSGRLRSCGRCGGRSSRWRKDGLIVSTKATRTLRGLPYAERETITAKVSKAAKVPQGVQALKKANGFGSESEVLSQALLYGLAHLEATHRPAELPEPDANLCCRSERAWHPEGIAAMS